MASRLREGVVPSLQQQGTPSWVLCPDWPPSSGRGGGAGEGPAVAAGRAGDWTYKRGGLGSTGITQLPGWQMQRQWSQSLSVGHEV